MPTSRVVAVTPIARPRLRAQAADPDNEWAEENRQELLDPSEGLIRRAGLYVTEDGLDALDGEHEERDARDHEEL